MRNATVELRSFAVFGKNGETLAWRTSAHIALLVYTHTHKNRPIGPIVECFATTKRRREACVVLKRFEFVEHFGLHVARRLHVLVKQLYKAFRWLANHSWTDNALTRLSIDPSGSFVALFGQPIIRIINFGAMKVLFSVRSACGWIFEFAHFFRSMGIAWTELNKSFIGVYCFMKERLSTVSMRPTSFPHTGARPRAKNQTKPALFFDFHFSP